MYIHYLNVIYLEYMRKNVYGIMALNVVIVLKMSFFGLKTKINVVERSKSYHLLLKSFTFIKRNHPLIKITIV